MRLVLICSIIVFVSVTITHVLNSVFKRKSYVKYLPSCVMLLFMTYNIISAKNPSYTGFEDLAKIVLALFAFFAGFSSLIYAIIVDIMKYKSK